MYYCSVSGSGSPACRRSRVTFRTTLATINNGQALLRPDPAKVLPRFLLHQLLSPVVQEEQIARLCKGSASPHLNIAALKRFILRIPPLADQHRIVAHLDALEAKVAAMKALQVETATELDALLPAILDRAYKGELS